MMMKKWKLLMMLMASILISGVIFTSCDDEDDQIIITFESAPETAEVGTEIEFSYSVISDRRLDEINFFKEGNIMSEMTIDDLGDNYYNGHFSYTPTVEDAGKNILFSIEVFDRRDNREIRTFRIEVEEMPSDIETYSAKLLGSHKNTDYGSSYNSSDNLVYILSDARENSELIDFIYFYGASNLATLASPDDSDAASVLTMSDWETRNSTTLALTEITKEQFNSMEDDRLITEAAEDASGTKANELSEGDVVFFETAAGVKGVVLVKGISEGDDGYMEIKVKIQK
ncbi:hypothetical protein QA597_01560 [Marinilabiliaceae bacterium ANBcel2]|nr:hypothetical protein [Marinilabiliaceae bacterium ANBcel2]